MKTVISAAALALVIATPVFAQDAKAPAAPSVAPAAKTVEAPKTGQPSGTTHSTVTTGQASGGTAKPAETVKTGEAGKQVLPAAGGSTGGGSSAAKPADAGKAPVAGAGSGQPSGQTQPSNTVKAPEAPKTDAVKK